MSVENRARSGEIKEPLLEFERVTVRYGAKPVLQDLTWSLERSRSWAVIGANGAGKSTFLKLVRGDIMPSPGSGRWFYRVKGRPQRSPIGFKERTRLVSSEMLDAYRRNGWDLTCLDVVLTGFADTIYLQEKPDPAEVEAAREALALAGLAHLAGAGINTLSQGQAKRVLVARALVARELTGEPHILLLDEVCEGLDEPSRQRLLDQVQKAAGSGTVVIQAVHRLGELIPAVTHYLRLEGGSPTAQGRLDEIRETGPAPGPRIRVSPPAVSPPAPDPAAGKEELFRLRGVDVFIDNRPILKNLDWTVLKGQHWAVLGPNGSGKPTLMRLLAGDLRTALGGVVVRFSDPSLKNLWHLRRRVSLVSAHYQAAHKFKETALRVALGGFLSGIGVVFEPEPEQVDKARHWLDYFGLGEHAGRDVTSLSYGQLRRVLLAKAMVIEPEILLLDEPTGGLDAPSRRIFLNMVERVAADGTAIVQTTHYGDELASCITHALFMEDGSFCSQGPLDPSGI